MNISTTEVSSISDITAVSGGVVTIDTLEYVPLVDHLMRNKFQLFNRNRQKLVGDILRRGLSLLRPTQSFTDSKQVIPFILMGYSYKPISDTYTVQLCEYDNTVNITLDIVETITTG
jgi:hypothetical protein